MKLKKNLNYNNNSLTNLFQYSVNVSGYVFFHKLALSWSTRLGIFDSLRSHMPMHRVETVVSTDVSKINWRHLDYHTIRNFFVKNQLLLTVSTPYA